MKDVIKDDTFLDMDYKYCDCIITAAMTAGRLQKYIFTKPYLFYSDGSCAGIAFSKYNENLCKRIDAALDGLKANTIFYTLYQKYYGSATGVSTAPIIQQQSLAPAIPIIYGICLKSTATFTDKTQAAQLQNSLFSIGITSQVIDTFYDYSLGILYCAVFTGPYNSYEEAAYWATQINQYFNAEVFTIVGGN
jgi:hypothetical protein